MIWGCIALVKDAMRHWDFMKWKDLGTLNDVAYTAPTCTGGGGLQGCTIDIEIYEYIYMSIVYSST